MIRGRIAGELAVLFAFCVLALLFFHATQGPYSAVHGPVTVLESMRAAARLRSAAAQSFLNSFPGSLVAGPLLLPWRASSDGEESRPLALDGAGAVLRC
jgi:hypothetical protein